MISENSGFNIGWCKRQHDLIKDGGVWGVPRSGLLFRKTIQGFELFDRMPWLPEMDKALAKNPDKDIPKTPEELITYQRSDFDCIRRHFKAAGLAMSDPKGLLNQTTK